MIKALVVLLSLGLFGLMVGLASDAPTPRHPINPTHSAQSQMDVYWVNMNQQFGVGVDLKSIKGHGRYRTATIVMAFNPKAGIMPANVYAELGSMEFDCQNEAVRLVARIFVGKKFNMLGEQIITSQPWLTPESDVGRVIVDTVCSGEPQPVPYQGPPPWHLTSPSPTQQMA